MAKADWIIEGTYDEASPGVISVDKAKRIRGNVRLMPYPGGLFYIWDSCWGNKSKSGTQVRVYGLENGGVFLVHPTELFERNANELRMKRIALCQADGPNRLPGRIGGSILEALAQAEREGYACGEVLEDKSANRMYVVCRNQQAYCDAKTVVNFRFNTTTLEVETINLGRPSEIINALTNQGRLAPGLLPRKIDR